MEQYNWAQGKLDELLDQPGKERHEEQRQYVECGNRAQRREQARQEKRQAKRAKAKA